MCLLNANQTMLERGSCFLQTHRLTKAGLLQHNIHIVSQDLGGAELRSFQSHSRTRGSLVLILSKAASPQLLFHLTTSPVVISHNKRKTLVTN